jgi:uncharacterized membrane-anchored protein
MHIRYPGCYGFSASGGRKVVLYKEAVDKNAKVIYEKGCEFNGDEIFDPARKAALPSLLTFVTKYKSIHVKISM